MFYKFNPSLIFAFTIAISFTLNHKANAFTFTLSANVVQPSDNAVFTVSRPEETVSVTGNTRGGFSITKQQNDVGTILFTLQNTIFHAGARADSFISRNVNFDALQAGGTIDFANFPQTLTREVGVGTYNTQSFTNLYQGGTLSTPGELPTGATDLGFRTDIHRWSVVVSTPETSSVTGLLALGTLGAASTLKRKLKSSKSTEKETTKIG
jgi:hypothetical protein